MSNDSYNFRIHSSEQFFKHLLVKESESASVLKLLYSRHYKPVLDYKFLIGLDIKEALLNIKHANHIFFKS